jgi:DNA-binding NarL/FixJ family response regulator
VIRVLLADDHAIVRDVLRFLLEAAGDMEIVGLASNGQEAVNLAGVFCPDVAVLDVSMPLMGGIEATKQIRILCPGTRILMLSMHHTNDYVQRCLNVGALGYVLKDAAGSELVTAVRSVYQGNKHFSKPVADLAMRFFERQK